MYFVHIFITLVLLTSSLISSSCPPPPDDIGDDWVCYPEPPTDQDIPNNTNCILTCGAHTSAHTCSNSSWTSDPALVRCISPSCPPIYGTDPTGYFSCFPPLSENSTAPPGTFCIYSCGGHPVDEITCQEDGHWTSDPDHVQCGTTPTTDATTTTTAVASTSTTEITTTMEEPSMGVELLWGFYYFGDGIGRTGILGGDFDKNGRTEFVLGSGNSKISILEYQNRGYQIVWEEILSKDFEISIKHIAQIDVEIEEQDGWNTTINYAAIGVEKGHDGVIFVYNLETRNLERVIEGFKYIYKIATVDINQDDEHDILVVSSDSDACSRQNCDITLTVYNYNWTRVKEVTFPEKRPSVVFGSFTEPGSNQMILSSGEIYQFKDMLEELEEVGSFNAYLGRYLFSYDLEFDGIDEIICSKGGDVSAYSAVDQGRLWFHGVDISIDSMEIMDLDNDGRLDVIYGDDQWGEIHALNILTGEEFWQTHNPEHGVTGIIAGDFDLDGDMEVAWGAGFSSSGADYFFIYDVGTKEEEWRSYDLDSPFNGFDIHDPLGDEQFEITLVSSESDSGYHGGLTFGIDFKTKKELWITNNGGSWSGTNALTTDDIDGDGIGDVITAGSNTYDGRVHCMEGVNGSLKYTTKLDSVLFSVLTVDMEEDGYKEIIVGDADSGITFLNGEDGTIIKTIPSIGSWGIEELALRRDNSSLLTGILALSTPAHNQKQGSVYLYDTNNEHIIKLTDDSITAMATVNRLFPTQFALYTGNNIGLLQEWDYDNKLVRSLQLCPGPVTNIQTTSYYELSYVCGESGEWGILDMLSGQKLLRDNSKGVTKVLFKQVYGKSFLLTGGEVIRLYKITPI